MFGGQDLVHTKVHLVRLLAAIAGSTAGCFFVSVYSRLSHFRFLYEHADGRFCRGAEFLSERAWVGYAVPAIALLVGIWALRRSGSPVLFEIIVALTWVLSLVWFGSCLLIWQSQNCPTFSH